jgi:prophage regulatory protein
MPVVLTKGVSMLQNQIRIAQDAPKRLLRLRQLITKLNVSRSTLYSWLNSHSKYCIPTFPQPIRIGCGRAVFWNEIEIDHWLEGHVASTTKKSNLK